MIKFFVVWAHGFKNISDNWFVLKSFRPQMSGAMRADRLGPGVAQVGRAIGVEQGLRRVRRRATTPGAPGVCRVELSS